MIDQALPAPLRKVFAFAFRVCRCAGLVWCDWVPAPAQCAGARVIGAHDAGAMSTP